MNDIIDFPLVGPIPAYYFHPAPVFLLTQAINLLAIYIYFKENLVNPTVEAVKENFLHN